MKKKIDERIHAVFILFTYTNKMLHRDQIKAKSFIKICNTLTLNEIREHDCFKL